MAVREPDAQMRVCFKISQFDPLAIQMGVKKLIRLFDDERGQFLRRKNAPVQNTEPYARKDKEQGNSDNDDCRN